MPQGETGGDSSGGLPRLPPGRHGLSREFVAENQRQRIAAALIEAVVEHGYNAATVMNVVDAAGVSRRAFYNHYSDKQDAFFEVYRQVSDFVCDSMNEVATPPTGGWPAHVRARLEVFLGIFAANTDLVSFCLEAAPAAGGKVAAVYRDFLERILEILRAGRPKRAKLPPPAVEYGLVGGLAALVVATVAGETGKSLEDLLPEVTELVLTPYVGREAAVRIAAA